MTAPSRPSETSGLLAFVTWEQAAGHARWQRDRCAAFAAGWRARGTELSVQMAEWNEARAARLDAVIAALSGKENGDG